VRGFAGTGAFLKIQPLADKTKLFTKYIKGLSDLISSRAIFAETRTSSTEFLGSCVADAHGCIEALGA
jgi:hypothetical protein